MSDKPALELTISAEDDKVEFLLVNSYSGLLPSFNSMEQRGFSTKGPNRGIGLHDVMRKVRSSNNIDYTMSNDDRYVTQLLTMGS